MKSASNIVSAIHHLKLAHEHWADFIRDVPGSKGARLFAQYQKRIEFIKTDLLTHPFLPETVREGINREWNSDVFAMPALNEKIPLLSPEQRDLLETVVDGMLKGETIQIEKT